MIRQLTRFIATIVAAFGIAAPASATTYSTDWTDSWYNAAENGWGLNLIQQYDNIFGAMYVYGSDGTGRWFVAPNLVSSNGGTVFTSQLYSATGPFYGAAWNPAAYNATAVGSMTITFTSLTTATLQYTANGTNVSKSITRFTFKNNNLSGKYIGGLTAIGSGCRTVANGPILAFDNLSVSQNGTSMTMTVTYFTSATAQATCTFTGNYGQAGRLATFSGNWNCTTGNTGTFTMSELEASRNGFSGNFTGVDQFCNYSGYFGGVKDVI